MLTVMLLIECLRQYYLYEDVLYWIFDPLFTVASDQT